MVVVGGENIEINSYFEYVDKIIEDDTNVSYSDKIFYRKREETVRNRNKSYGFDVEEQLTNILTQQLSKSINEEIVKNILKEHYLTNSGIYINNII